MDNENIWPFNKPAYLMLMTRFRPNIEFTTEGWTKVSSDENIETYQNYLYIDYIRVYSLAEKKAESKKITVEKTKIKSAKRISKKSIIVKFKKAKNAKKYQIQYATNKKFKKAKKKTIKKRSYTIKKISAKKTYYIRVRGINGTKKGAWSKIKIVKRVKKKKY